MLHNNVALKQTKKSNRPTSCMDRGARTRTFCTSVSETSCSRPRASKVQLSPQSSERVLKSPRTRRHSFPPTHSEHKFIQSKNPVGVAGLVLSCSTAALGSNRKEGEIDCMVLKL